MSDITRIEQTINFDIASAKDTVNDNITVMEARESELIDFSEHVRSVADNISYSKEGYTKIVKLLVQLEEAMIEVDNEAESAMSDADSIDTAY